MITRKEITDYCEQLLNSEFCIPLEDISYKQTFAEIGMDSLDVFEFFMAVEEEFNVEIPDVAKESINNIDSVATFFIDMAEEGLYP